MMFKNFRFRIFPFGPIVRWFSAIFLIIFLSSTIFTLIQRRKLSTSAFSIGNQEDLIENGFVLVPININNLYDHRVVCESNDGILDREKLIKNFTTICQTKLDEKVQIDFQIPDDFQIRSVSSEKYRKFWQIDNKCSIFNNETIAIIISFRDRHENLRKLLFNLFPFLQRQHLLNFRIFIVEQVAKGPFNKGRLYNIAFQHLMKTFKPTCVIFHGEKILRVSLRSLVQRLFSSIIRRYLVVYSFLDVDLIPENAFHFYSCPTDSDRPVHLSSKVHYKIGQDYTIIYPFLVGGVFMVRPKVFVRLNGMSNRYFNWGGEDDDFGLRMLAKKVCVQRSRTASYFVDSHPNAERNPQRFSLLFDAVLYQNIDGLSDVETLARIVDVISYPLVTWLTVDWIS